MSAPDPYRHPAWFGAVMGTGALALAIASQATTWDRPWLTDAAFAVLLLASVLAIVLWPRYVVRLGDRERLRAEIADPAHGPMLGTFPAGLLVLSVGWGRLAPEVIPLTPSLWIAGVLLVVGAVLAIALGWAWSASLVGSSNGLESVNGGWLIPPVMNLLVPLALTPFIVVHVDAAPLLVLVGLAFLGVGLVLFLSVLTLLIARLALRDPHPSAMAPSLWIPLAPAGILGLATLRLFQAATTADVAGFTGATVGVAVSAMGIGFGLWWAGFAWFELRRMRRSGAPPVHPGWWGFVFPVAAMTLSIAAVGSATGVDAVRVLGLVATIGLTVLWLFVAARTVRLLTRRGSAA